MHGSIRSKSTIPMETNPMNQRRRRLEMCEANHARSDAMRIRLRPSKNLRHAAHEGK